MNATVELLRTIRDARGLLVEPLTAGELGSQQNVHVVVTAPGAVRGNHYHERGTETALALGPGLIRYRDSAMHDVRLADGEVRRFTFPPGVAHAYGATGPGPLILVVFNTAPHDGAAPDTIPAVLLDPGALAARCGA
jgi:dTDP-4-dehydrorhamnose 3,5-epimerase-like enzyme